MTVQIIQDRPQLMIVRGFRYLPITLLLCLLAALLIWPLAEAAEQPAIRYTMLVDVDYDKAFLNVAQAVQYTNRTDIPLSALVFNVPPAAFRAFTISSATVNDVPVKPVEDGAMLEIPVPDLLQPGDTATVVLRWWGQLPPSDGRYGAAEGVLILGNWYPMLSVLHSDGTWERHQYTPIGDAFFSDIASYDVTVNVPSHVVVAASGIQVARKGGQWQFRAENARDFALGIASRYQTLSRKVDNVTITVYYLGDRYSEAARTSIDIAEQSMRWYAKKIAPYPFSTLAIVQIPSGGQHVAQEHAGLFFLRSDIFTPATVGVYVAHELAHAWFFASTGNDQIHEPWLDEALATSISLDFYREHYSKEYTGLWGAWGGSPDDFKETLPMNRGIMDFNNGSVYFFTVYRQGATFFKAIREAMGDDAYWKALQTYYKENAFRTVGSRDLLRILRQSSPRTDLLPIFRKFLDYPYLKYGNLSINIGGDEGQRWDGQVTVPITVAADSPTYALRVLLDGAVLTDTNRTATLPALTLIVDTSSLSDGQHVLTALVEDSGINRSEARRTFLVQKPTPTPTPSPTPTITPTATSTRAPTQTTTQKMLPAPSPTPAPSSPTTAGDRSSPSGQPTIHPFVIIGGLAAAALVFGGVGVLVWNRNNKANGK